MYSTDVGEHAHKVQIKEGYRHSNKNDATWQILDYYGSIHAFSMRYQTLSALERAGEHAGLPGDVEHLLLGETGLSHPREGQDRSTRPKRLLKGPYANVDSLMHLWLNLDVLVARIFEELLKYIRRSLTFDEHLPEDVESLGMLPTRAIRLTRNTGTCIPRNRRN